MKKFHALLLLTVPLAACSSAVNAGTTPVPVSTLTIPHYAHSAQLDGIEGEVLALTNKARAAGATCGSVVMPPVGTLTMNDQLRDAAIWHSADMAARSYFEHSAPEGDDAGVRITAAHYVYRSWGENIARNFPDARAVVDAWMASPGHCHNIMTASFRELGVGVVESDLGRVWTQNFGSR